ncbi:MAG: hypothetical protein RL398_1608 [Planctomycetota bacterium]
MPLVFAAFVAAQDGVRPATTKGSPRLVDRVEAPLLYLALEGVPQQIGVAEPGAEREGAQGGPVHALLADPAVGALFGRPSDDQTSAGRALSLVRGVITRSAGDVELALTAVVPSNGQPLLVLRARLQTAAAGRLGELLAAPDFAAPERRLGATQTYRLAGEDPNGRTKIELAVVGDDLVVANDVTAMEELLSPYAAVTSAASSRRVLSADKRYTDLKTKVSAGPGSLLVYADWQRLGGRDDAEAFGLPETLLDASGLDDARSVMASIVAAPGGFSTTLLVDFVSAPPPNAAEGGKTALGDIGIDGWLDAIRRAPARSLVGSVPDGGLGSMVLALDLQTLASRSNRGADLLHDVEHAYEEIGLDFRRKFLDHVGTSGALQIAFDAEDRPVTVFSLRAKNRRAAVDLFGDLRKALEAESMGRLLAPAAKGDPEILEIRSAGRRHRDRHSRPAKEPILTLFAAVHDDSLLLAAEPASLVAVHGERQQAKGQRAKRNEALLRAVAGLGSGNVAGLVDMDLRPLFARLAFDLTGPDEPTLDFAQLPQRHTGIVEVDPRSDGATLRIRFASVR